METVARRRRVGGSGLLLIVSALAGAPSAAAQDSSGWPVPRFELELETGPVWQTRNDVRIPNDTGTRFALDDLIGAGPSLAVRFTAIWTLDRRHALRVLAAPLSFTGDGISEEPIDFAGERFAAGVSTRAEYRFGSYRLTYRYRVFDRSGWTGQIGFTAKIRDAKVELRGSGRQARDTDVGFVPLVHLAAAARFSERWRLFGTLDAAAASQGRAEDLALGIAYDLHPRWMLSAAYRTLEGGADVDAVYAFAWLHYAAFSVTYRTGIHADDRSL